MILTSYPKEKLKVLLLENIHQGAKEAFVQQGYVQTEIVPKALPFEELKKELNNTHILGIRSKTQLTDELFSAAPKLIGVGCFCIGTNQVDLTAAARKGVAVFNSPYSNTRSVAELVLAECVMLLRRIPEKSNLAHQGKWMKDAYKSYELRGKTLGIVGYGHIGSQVSVLAEAMGMNVLYYDIEPKLPLGNAGSSNSLEDLLGQSDIVSLHVPATSETQNMINAAAFEKMREGSYLINLSRGNVVDIDALRENILSGKIAGAAVDVFPKEPKSKDDAFESPLCGLKNVILTPHIGGSTIEAQENIGKDVATKLIGFIEKGSTVGSHSLPAINLSSQSGTHRILHIHKNVPGVLSEINSCISEMGANVSSQFLATNEHIGYAVLDVDTRVSEKALEGLKKVEHTIRTRLVY